MDLATEETIQHHFGGGVYIKQATIPAQHVLVQHRHRFEHLTILARGRVVMTGVEYEGPHVFVIPAGAHHGCRTLTECLWFCVHSTNQVDIDKLDEILFEPSDPTTVRQFAERIADASNDSV